MDEDGDGTVSKKEFRKAIPVMGFVHVSEAEIDTLFDQLDADGDGALALNELETRLAETARDASGAHRNISLSQIFAHVAELQRSHPVEECSVTQSTLESVFLTITGIKHPASIHND